MRVRLLTRWGSRLQGDIVSVSEERALYLESQGIAKVLDPKPEPVAEALPDSPAEAPAKAKTKK